MTLEEARKRIDALDHDILDAFLQRMKISGEIASEKERLGLPTADPSREQNKLANIRTAAGDDFADYAGALMEKLMELSKTYQEDFRFRAAHPGGKGLRCGLLGGHLGHSFSPSVHGMLADYEYRLYETEPAQLPEFLRSGEWDCLNVTIPYKKDVVPFCSRLTEAAERTGSVNTLVRTASGIVGSNTDFSGFLDAFSAAGFRTAGKKCLILGTGGAAQSVHAALETLGAREIVTVSRSGRNNYDNLYLHSDAQIIVNATPVGMFPDNGCAPLSLRQFCHPEAVFDLIYNPSRTALLLEAESLGIPCSNGLSMLVYQAARSAELFLRTPVDPARTEQVLRQMERKTKNIVLIGMPGSGKTTVGRLLAEMTGRTFADCDELFPNWTGMSVPDYISVYGESGFRLQESSILDELGRASGLVIATGGGAVTYAPNYALLHQNSTVVLIHRALSLLSSRGRPISMERGVETLWAEREPLYRRFSDLCVDNVGTPEETAKAILEALQ